jgi:5-hydroxyisourate hydrolase
MASLSTHVLDTSQGRPAEGLRISLESAEGEVIAEGRTNQDGRVAPLGPESLTPGEYVVRFDTGDYLGPDAFYPEVVVHFRAEGDQHYHVPLLLNPFGYSTYRGS